MGRTAGESPYDFRVQPAIDVSVGFNSADDGVWNRTIGANDDDGAVFRFTDAQRFTGAIQPDNDFMPPW